jgi:hypothetical protein
VKHPDPTADTVHLISVRIFQTGLPIPECYKYVSYHLGIEMLVPQVSRRLELRRKLILSLTKMILSTKVLFTSAITGLAVMADSEPTDWTKWSSPGEGDGKALDYISCRCCVLISSTSSISMSDAQCTSQPWISTS